jgi:hypothetical protein
MKKLFLILFAAAALQVQAQSGKTEALEALGGSCGMLLYNTYLVIGEAADAYGGDVYDAATVEEIVQEQLDGIKTIKEQYNALMGTDFLSDPEDVKFMKRTLSTFDMVAKEGKALIAFVNSGSDADAGTYDDLRKEAWAEIADLLGIDQ